MLGTGLASEVPTHMLTLVCKHTHYQQTPLYPHFYSTLHTEM